MIIWPIFNFGEHHSPLIEKDNPAGKYPEAVGCCSSGNHLLTGDGICAESTRTEHTTKHADHWHRTKPRKLVEECLKVLPYNSE